MGLNLIISLVVGVFLLGGGAALWKSIGDKKVAAYQAQVQKEQEKIDAATATKVALEAKHVDELQFVWAKGQEEGRRNAPRIAARTQADRAAYPVFQNPDCTLPAPPYGLYQAALSTLAKGDIPDATLNATAPAAPHPLPAQAQGTAQGKPPPVTPATRPVRNPLTGATK